MAKRIIITSGQAALIEAHIAELFNCGLVAPLNLIDALVECGCTKPVAMNIAHSVALLNEDVEFLRDGEVDSENVDGVALGKRFLEKRLAKVFNVKLVDSRKRPLKRQYRWTVSWER